MMHCAHVAAYYSWRADGSLCEFAYLAAVYALASEGHYLK